MRLRSQIIRGEDRRKNTKYVERRLNTWGSIEAIIVDKSYSVGRCVDGKYKVVSKIIRIIASDTGEPMTSPSDVSLYLVDNRRGKERRNHA